MVGSLRSLRSLRSLGIKNQTDDADAMNRVPTIEMIFDGVIGRINSRGFDSDLGRIPIRPYWPIYQIYNLRNYFGNFRTSLL